MRINDTENPAQSIRTSRKGRAATTMIAAAAAVSILFTGPAASAAVQLKDNPLGSAHHEAVQWMADWGITAGDTRGNFNKSADVTRGQTASFLYKYIAPTTAGSKSDPFGDVKVGGANHQAISWLVSTAITTGFADGNFYQSKPVTRGEFSAFLYRLADPTFTAPKTTKLTDVKPGGANYQAITWVSATGITSGFGDGTFKQSKPITRAEMASFLSAFDKKVTLVSGKPKPKPSTPAPKPTEPKPTQPVTPKPVEPTPTEPTQPKPVEPVTGFPSWHTGTKTVAPAPAASLDYTQRARHYVDHYGCQGTSIEIKSAAELGYANGAAASRDGSPSAIWLSADMADSGLNRVAAHECMHVLQHKASGYNRAASQSSLGNWYNPSFVNRYGETVNVFEQNAECALRTLGLSSNDSSYSVECDARGLHAGWAIASGLNPNSVTFKG